MKVLGLGRALTKQRQVSDPKGVFDRLRQANRLRLERARSLLGPRQQLFLDFLPLLFHCNHPSLPGFQSLTCPAGISHYRPNTEMVERVRRHLANSFQYLEREQPPALEALYLMGSIGSIAHAPSSDIDVWVCHRPALTDQDRAGLQRKCSALSEYAQSALGLEIHFFLMCASEFRGGERQALSAENCGSTQHFLLLDEFYRSAIQLAGKYPRWWLIPTDTADYSDAVKAFRSRHRKLARLTHDFGNLHQIPAGEYIGAGIWQLFKAISKPHKSLIKLLLIEAYASGHPGNSPIAESFKQELHNPHWQPVATDAYQRIYAHLEDFLVARGETERLELLRRAFYIKTELELTRESSAPNWREQALRELVTRWDWTEEHLRNLDLRHTWRVQRVREEHLALVRELTGSYRFLQDFAAHNQAEQLISSREMSVLGRKLFSAFERQPEKIDWINWDISQALAERNLSFCYLGRSGTNKACWALIPGRVSRNNWHTHSALREGESLPALICWCLCSGLINQDTRLHLASDHPDHHRGKLEHLVRTLEGILPQKPYATQENQHHRFEAPRRLESLTCIVGNASQAGSFDTPLVRHVDVIAVSSWGEVSCKAHTGNDAIARALHSTIKAIASQTTPPQLEVRPFSANADLAADEFLQNLEALQAFLGQAANGDRYVLESGRVYYQFQRRKNGIGLSSADSFPQLARLLSQTSEGHISVCRDNPRLSALCRVADLQCKNEVRVVFHRREEAADIYIVDGQGAIHHQSLLCDNSSVMLAQLKNFLQALRKDYFSKQPLRWFELSGEPDQWQLQPLAIQTQADRVRISVVMLAHRSADTSHRFDLTINQRTLYFAQYGKDILKYAAKHIREELPGMPLRFCYVNRIFYRDNRAEENHISLRLAEALQHKAQIEEALNSALLASTPADTSRLSNLPGSSRSHNP